MHRHDALNRKLVVQDAENRLLHLTGIGCTANKDQLFGKVHGDDCLAPASMTRRIGAKTGQIDDRKFRRERGEFVCARANKERADKQAVPRKFVDDADVHAVLRLRPAEQVLHEQRFFRRDRCHEIGF